MARVPCRSGEGEVGGLPVLPSSSSDVGVIGQSRFLRGGKGADMDVRGVAAARQTNANNKINRASMERYVNWPGVVNRKAFITPGSINADTNSRTRP